MSTDDPTDGKPRVCAILGMHRSGTSWLAGSLEQLGLALGEVSEADPHNVRGNRESAVLMEIHEGVLRDNGGSWKRPPARVAWSPERRAALAAHIGEMNGRYPLWGFKDPRALLLMDEWRRQVPEGLVRVGIYRHPRAVHRSLASRNARFTPRRSFRVWRAYNRRLVEEHRREPFPLLRFDVAKESLFAGLVDAAAVVGLDVSGDPSAFFDESLVHNREASAEPVPWRCRTLWGYLEEQAASK